MATTGQGVSRHAAERQARQMQLLNDVALRLSSILTIEELLWEVVRLIQTTLGYYYVHICTVDEERQVAVLRAGWDWTGPRRDMVGWPLRLREEGMVGWVAWSGEPLLANDVREQPHYFFDGRYPSTRSELTVPVKRGDKTIGVLDVQEVQPDAFDADDVALLETLARQVSVAIENATLFERLTQSHATLEEKARDLDSFVERAAHAQEEERRRIALDMHDGVVQLVVGVRFELEGMRNARSLLSPEARDQLNSVCHVLEECAEEMRRVIFDIYPPGLEDLGLVPTLGHYLATYRRLSGLECAMVVRGQAVRLPLNVELGAYRVIQEALSNVSKHGGGAIPEVVLRFRGGGLRASVRDDGPGFDSAHLEQSRPCFGLESMRRNAARIGAALGIRSIPGRGTEVTLLIPPVEGCSRGGSHE